MTPDAVLRRKTLRTDGREWFAEARLSASTPWKSKSYGDLIRESMCPDVHFPPGPFKGVSEEGESGHHSTSLNQADAQMIRGPLIS